MSAKQKAAAKKGGGGNLTTLALVMMNVTIIAGLSNDVQQAFYGLSSVTFFIIGALVFFVPTGLVAAELASGWTERGGIFRWVGEGVGRSWAFVCIFILWFQTTFLFGANAANFTATIGFYGPDFDWAVQYAQNPTNELVVLIGWIAFYWIICWVATKGVKAFSRVAKYGVVIGTLIPLTVMTILAIVWLAQGHTPNIAYTPEGLVPKWEGMATLALAAGVFFSFAGIDMNAAHIKQLKEPDRQYPLAIFISMIIALVIFMLGTLIIATVIPNNQLNVLYSLFATYRDLGATIGCPWLYMLFVYMGLGNTMANLIANLAGPSTMLGSAGRSGFLPKFLQNENKHGMPSRLMYFQLALMTITAFLVFLLPNAEGFFVLMIQAITILYLIYYVLMFVAFIRLRYQQPNRPRSFKVPGGKFGAWLVGGVGIAASIFGIVLALYPPAQIQAEIGSDSTYVIIVVALVLVVFLVSFGIYFLSRKRDWVDPKNEFSPFTWEIEGLKKPEKVLSNVPSSLMAEGQDPMGMPIKRPYDPNAQIELPPAYAKYIKTPKKKVPVAASSGSSADASASGGSTAGQTMSAAASMAATVVTKTPPSSAATVPTPTDDEIKAAPLPSDAKKAAADAEAQAKAAKNQAEKLNAAAKALEDEAAADELLEEAREEAKTAHAAAVEAEKAAGIDPAPKADAPKADTASEDASSSDKS